MSEPTEPDLLEVINKIDPRTFASFAMDLSREALPDAGLDSEVRLGPFQIDILAREPGAEVSRPRLTAFEVKRVPLATVDLVRAQIGRRDILRMMYPNLDYVLIVGGQLTAAARHTADQYGLTVWDNRDIVTRLTPGLREKWFGLLASQTESSTQARAPKADGFIAALDSIAPGEDSALQYQKWVADAFEFLFVPPLGPVHYEDPDGERRNRRDLILENWAADGFWAQVRSAYRADQVVVDAKNYTGPLKKRPVLDLSHYLKPYGCGMFGILCSRKGAAPSAIHAIREQWIGGGKLILVLSDALLAEMLRLKASRTPPEEVLRREIANFRKSL